MFQFRRFPTYCYFIHSTLTRYCRAGFPHSDIHGSKDICSSPWLFAACHVLLRLLLPRHSPCALSSLTFVGAKSARLRFRRQPMAVCENCARFLAPPLNFKTRFEVVCGGTLNADLTPCYGHIAVSQNYAGVTEVFAYCCVTLKSSTFFSLPRFSRGALCCLACFLCSVFKVQQESISRPVFSPQTVAAIECTL